MHVLVVGLEDCTVAVLLGVVVVGQGLSLCLKCGLKLVVESSDCDCILGVQEIQAVSKADHRSNDRCLLVESPSSPPKGLPRSMLPEIDAMPQPVVVVCTRRESLQSY